MNQGIVIVSWSGGEECLSTLINSIPRDCPYPLLVVINDGNKADWLIPWLKSQKSRNMTVIVNPVDGYEVGAIKIALEVTGWDEFIFLQDTIEIIDPSIFDILFNQYPDAGVSYNEGFQMYLGKFRREVLEQMKFPIVKHKLGAIAHEFYFVKQYTDIEPVYVFNKDFYDKAFLDDPANYDEKFGRKNLVLKDKYIIKRKAAYTEDHITDIAKDLGLTWWRKEDDDTVIHTR